MTTQPATPLSELNPVGAIYPFAERFRVATASTTSTDFWNIPAKTIITMVLVRVVTAPVDAGGSNIIVGDDDDDNGYILAASICCGVTAGTIYGDAIEERGAYLNDVGGTAIATHAGKWKTYESAGTEMSIALSAAVDTEGVVDVFVFGYRYTG